MGDAAADPSPAAAAAPFPAENTASKLVANDGRREQMNIGFGCEAEAAEDDAAADCYENGGGGEVWIAHETPMEGFPLKVRERAAVVKGSIYLD